MQYNRWGVKDQFTKDIWMFALSVHYVKKNGHEIVLHTDKLGKNLCSVLPYDDVYLTLEENKYLPLFWASGKILAQEQEPIGAVHIDGDVFLRKQASFDRMDGEYGLLVQADEVSVILRHTMNILRPYMILKYKKHNLFDGEIDSYNCGVVRFKNSTLKEEYIHAYKEIVDYLSRSETLRKMLESNYDHHFSPDLLLEQFLLKRVALQKNVQVKTLLSSREHKIEHNYAVRELGFEHPCSHSKYCTESMSRIKNELKMQNPDYYNKICEHVNRIKIQVIERTS